MQIGIAGLPGAGKTTLFNALAHQHAHVGGYTGAEPNLAVVKVPDERLDKLSALFVPQKHTPADVTFVDVAGVANGMGQCCKRNNQSDPWSLRMTRRKPSPASAS